MSSHESTNGTFRSPRSVRLLSNHKPGRRRLLAPCKRDWLTVWRPRLRLARAHEKVADREPPKTHDRDKAIPRGQVCSVVSGHVPAATLYGRLEGTPLSRLPD